MAVENDYEAQRLANIRENEKKMRELGLASAASAIASDSRKLKTKSKPKPRSLAGTKRKTRGDSVTSEPASSVGRRTSSRLSGIPADSEIAKEKAEEEIQARLEADRLKRQRNGATLNLEETLLQGVELWEQAKSVFSKPCSKSIEPLSYLASDGIEHEGSRRDRGNTTEVKEDAALLKQMSRLELFDKWQPSELKITPDRIFSIGMHPSVEQKLVFAGDKAGHLGVWDVDGLVDKIKAEFADGDEEDAQGDESDHEPVLHHFKLHTRTISDFVFHPSSSDKLFSASYDGSIRTMDLVAHNSVESYSPLSDDSPLTSLTIHPHGNVVYFSTIEGTVGVKDLRLRQAEVTLYQLHDRKIGCLDVCPRNPDILVTSSLDRTMKLWDLRRLVGADKQPTFVAEYSCALSVSSAYFSSEGSILATSYDDTVKVFEPPVNSKRWSELGSGLEDPEIIEPTHVTKHNNQTGRWLTVFKAHWQQDPLDHIQKAVIGNMSRGVDILNSRGQLVRQLKDEYRITAVPAVAAWHRTKNWVVGGNASGKVMLWTSI